MCTQDDELSVKLHLYLVQNYYKSLMTYILFLIGSWWDITNIQHRFVIPVDISQLPEDEPSDPLGTDVLRSSSPSSKWLHTVTEAMERVCFVRLFVLMWFTIGSLHTGFYFENCSDSLCRSCVWPPVGLDLWNFLLDSSACFLRGAEWRFASPGGITSIVQNGRRQPCGPRRSRVTPWFHRATSCNVMCPTQICSFVHTTGLCCLDCVNFIIFPMLNIQNSKWGHR